MVETPGKITLWQIEIFSALAQENSISAAAGRLGASPSAVSQQMSNLEAALGATLVNRAERPTTLTPAGEMFLRRAELILNEAELAAQELAHNDLAARVRLRLGVVEDFDADVTPALLTQLADKMPGTQFLLETGASHRLIAQLDARALDAVIAAEPQDLTTAHQVWPLLRDPFVSVAPKGLKVSAETLIGDLAGLPFIGYTSRHVMGRQINAYLSKVNLDVTQRFELDSYHAIMAMVARGEGWSILTPLGVMRAHRFLNQVDTATLPFGPLSRQISLIIRRGEDVSFAAELATLARPLIEQEIVSFCHERMPWLHDQMTVLSD